MKNDICFKVRGRYALFTDPLTKVGGEKCSYHIPTYEALKGVCCSIYWKPTFTWFVDEVRVMKKIRTEAKSIKPLEYGGGNTLATYTYLVDVEYQVRAHFEWNLQREDMKEDRVEGKHYSVAMRMLEKGGRRDIFLGTRECQGYVDPCSFSEGSGEYDEVSEQDFGIMFHSFDYPDTTGEHNLYSRFWKPVMRNGVIEFPRPEECTMRKHVRKMKPNAPRSTGLMEEGLV